MPSYYVNKAEIQDIVDLIECNETSGRGAIFTTSVFSDERGRSDDILALESSDL